MTCVNPRAILNTWKQRYRRDSRTVASIGLRQAVLNWVLLLRQGALTQGLASLSLSLDVGFASRWVYGFTDLRVYIRVGLRPTCV
jgi:hypothetical protein